MCTTVCCCMELIKWSVTLRILQDWTPVAETLRLNGANWASGEDLMPDWTVHVAVEINEAAFTLQARNCDDSVKKKRTKHTASYLLSSDSGLFCCFLFIYLLIFLRCGPPKSYASDLYMTGCLENWGNVGEGLLLMSMPAPAIHHHLLATDKQWAKLYIEDHMNNNWGADRSIFEDAPSLHTTAAATV